MNLFELTLADIDNFCTTEKIPYSIIGGLALIAYKIHRTTNDIDVNLLINLEELEIVSKKISDKFKPLFTDPIQFFQTNFVLPVLDNGTGLQIDFLAGLTSFDKQVIQRSKRINFGRLKLPFCSIEDLILYKLFANRPKDNADLFELAKLHHENLDRKYITNMLAEFSNLDRNDMRENFRKIFLSQ